MSSTIPFIDFGGEGEIIHFAHANGFPPKAYQQLLNELIPQYHVIGMEARPIWKNSDYKTFESWRQGADDLIRFLDERKLTNIIGAGHSFGAVCSLIAANKRPDLFKKLILIEPVVLPKWYYAVNSMPSWAVKLVNPLIKKTLERTERWPNKDSTFKQFRRKKVFSLMSDEALWDYVNAATSENERDEVYLNFSKEWEAQIYMTATNPWRELKVVNKPFLAIRGETSDTIFSNVWKKWKAINKTGRLIEIEGSGHLVPFEKPREVANSIVTFLNS